MNRALAARMKEETVPATTSQDTQTAVDTAIRAVSLTAEMAKTMRAKMMVHIQFDADGLLSKVSTETCRLVD